MTSKSDLRKLNSCFKPENRLILWRCNKDNITFFFHVKNERLYSNQGKGDRKKDKKNP